MRVFVDLVVLSYKELSHKKSVSKTFFSTFLILKIFANFCPKYEEICLFLRYLIKNFFFFRRFDPNFRFWPFQHCFPIIEHFLLRGEGGLRSKQCFLFSNIYCSPDHPLSKMGSFVSQLQTVAEIWRDECWVMCRGKITCHSYLLFQFWV